MNEEIPLAQDDTGNLYEEEHPEMWTDGYSMEVYEPNGILEELEGHVPADASR